MSARGRRSRFVVSTAAAVVAALSLAGCGPAADTGDGKSNVLRVQVSQGDKNPEIGQALVDGFVAANPGIEVKIELITQEAVKSTNLAVLSGANPPDVGLLQTGTAGYQALVADGGLVDLADVWSAADLDNRYPETLNQNLSYGGAHYSIGLATGYYNVIFYNKDLFAKAGIPEPRSHRIASVDELKGMVDKLAAVGAGGVGFGASAGFPASWMIDAVLPTLASPEQLESYLTSYQVGSEATAKYTDESFVAALRQLQEIAELGVFPQGYLSADLGKATADFSAQRVGMLHQGYWAATELRSGDLPFDFDWALLPPADGSDRETQLSSYFATGYSIPRGAKNVDLAKKFLEYMVSVEAQQRAVVEVGSQLPAVNDVPASAFEALDPAVQTMLADAKENGTQFGWTSAVPAPLGQALLEPLLQEMYAGSKTPEDLAKAVQAELEMLRRADVG